MIDRSAEILEAIGIDTDSVMFEATIVVMTSIGSSANVEIDGTYAVAPVTHT